MSRLGKLRRDPALFLRDAQSVWLQRVGRFATPILEAEVVRDLLLDPVETVADLPVVGALGRRLVARQQRRRRSLFHAAGTPLVTLIMAARNAEATIGEAIASLVAQTYQNLEIVVVDDGSDDATAEAARQINDTRIIVRSLASTRGAAHARNVGLTIARGELVTFNDADDRSHPERIERQLAALLAEPRAMMSLCSIQRENDAREVVTINGRRVAKGVITMLFRRREVLGQVGFLRELPVSEDAEYYERIKAAFGQRAEVVLLARLYFARFRRSSLLFGDGEITFSDDRTVHHRRSSHEDAEWSRILEQIERIRGGIEPPYVACSLE